MPNPQLDKSQREIANQMLDEIRARLDEVSGGDRDLRFAYLRRIWRMLSYDERGSPTSRGRLKRIMHEKQNGRCAICGKDLPQKDSVLDRHIAIDGYIKSNVRLIHRECDIAVQAQRGYS